MKFHLSLIFCIIISLYQIEAFSLLRRTADAKLKEQVLNQIQDVQGFGESFANNKWKRMMAFGGFGAIRKPDWYKVMQPIAPKLPQVVHGFGPILSGCGPQPIEPKLPQPITPNSDYLNLEMLRM